MFNLTNYPEIINFLQMNSSIYKKISNKEIQIHCPYCDDSMRKNATRHGHLYISTENPVFHCFRCDVSGSLGQLLNDLGFDNKSIIKEISKNIKLEFKKETKIIHKPYSDIYYKIKEKNEKYKSGDPENFRIFEEYVFKRLGNYIDYNKFLLTPGKVENQLTVDFFNTNGSLVTSRIIRDDYKKRYVRDENSTEKYFFQEPDFEQYQTINISEGIFDILNVLKYSDRFNEFETFSVALLSKRFVGYLFELCATNLVYGNYSINLFFDKDDKNSTQTLKRCKTIANRINSNIVVNGLLPTVSKDVGEFPFYDIVELQNGRK